MNGKTHQVSGLAATLTTTWLLAEYHAQIRTLLPEFLTPVFTPPAELLGIITHLKNVAGLANPESLSSIGVSEVNWNWSELVASVPQAFLQLFLIGLVGIIAGQFPDIDTPESTISNSFKTLSRHCRWRGFWGGLAGFIVRLVLLTLNLLPYTCAVIANKFFGHRGGIIHGIVGWFGFSLLFGLIFGAFWGFLFWVGYFTHLLVDSLSRSGVKWVWPLSDHSYHLIPAKELQFRTANPLHNAIAQSVFVIIAMFSFYQLATYLVAVLLPGISPQIAEGLATLQTLKEQEPGQLAGASLVPLELNLNESLRVVPLVISGSITLLILTGLWFGALRAYASYRTKPQPANF